MWFGSHRILEVTGLPARYVKHLFLHDSNSGEVTEDSSGGGLSTMMARTRQSNTLVHNHFWRTNRVYTYVFEG